ncbi:hypothetical protein FHS96_000444 [Sphingomonas zeicaulis]|uniref:hypothetical protein n=1 Tax=Sphingomonas zeicaulis TaxID=1632740 RepID=UPI003D221BA6
MTIKAIEGAAILAALVFIPAAMPLAAQAQTNAVAHRWESYANARYGYAICYPADLLVPQPEADNGDGRVFEGKAGASLRVFGHYNAAEQTMAEAMAGDALGLAHDGAVISYRASRPGWYVLSGRIGDTIVYRRTIAAGDRRMTFVLRYPASQAALWNPITARLGRCFAAG